VLQDRRRILVVGSGGAGKSTFARALAARTGLPLIHLDRHFWKPGWTPTPRDEWIDRVRDLSRGDSWIIDGNYGSSLSIRVQRCDAIVFFDLPRLMCVQGILQRRLAHQFTPRWDLAEGCPERLDLEFIRWVWDFRRKSRPRLLSVIEKAGPTVRVQTITRRVHARALLNALREAHG